MEKNRKNEAEKQLGMNGLAVVVALMALYGISCTAVQSWQIYTDDFAGIIELGIFSFAISVLWLFMYWFLDRLQHESVKMTLLAYILGVGAYLACEAIQDWIVGETDAFFIRSVGLPLLSFFLVFAFFVLKFPSFDELVDSFIYGGFVGTGIGFASCMSDFVGRDSLDGQFVIIRLITKISVYAAICSLSGFLIHQSLLRKKTVRLVASLAVTALLLAADCDIERRVLGNVAYAGVEIFSVLISAGFAIVLVAIVALLIRRILKEESAGADSPAVSESSAPAAASFAIVLLLLLVTLYVRYDSYRTKQFVSDDGAWTFSLPKDFSVSETKSDDSLSAFAALSPSDSKNAMHIENRSGSMQIDVRFGTESSKKLSLAGRMERTSAEAVRNGWSISSSKSRLVRNSSSSNPSVVTQTTYLLSKDGQANGIAVDMFSSDSEPAQNVERAMRVFIKTLEEK